MKRRIRCSTCGTTKNSATGKRLYIIGDKDVPLIINAVETECWDCGEARRELEKKKKQDRAEALVNRFSKNDAE